MNRQLENVLAYGGKKTYQLPMLMFWRHSDRWQHVLQAQLTSPQHWQHTVFDYGLLRYLPLFQQYSAFHLSF